MPHLPDRSSYSCSEDSSLAIDFIEFCVSCGVLRFGEFITKAGRISPYFFNAGLFNSGAKLQRLSYFYAQRILSSGLSFDMLFGPAYKGIPLVASIAVELARSGLDLPFAYNRKLAKDHGEGGITVGAPLLGNILVVDDVISAGTAMRESINLIQSSGATPFALAIALDRQEMATTIHEDRIVDLPYSAVQHIQSNLGIHVLSIAKLNDLLAYLELSAGSSTSELHSFLPKVQAYRKRYGVGE